VGYTQKFGEQPTNIFLKIKRKIKSKCQGIGILPEHMTSAPSKSFPI